MKRSLKNPLIFIVTAVIIFTAAAVVFASAASVKMIGISVTVKDKTLDSSDKTSVYTLSGGKSTTVSYYNVLDRDNITLTVKYSDQTSKKYTGAALTAFEAQNGLTLRADDDQMTSPWSAGTHTVTYSLGGFTSSVKYTVAANEIASVSISPMHPVEVIYHYSGEYKLLGSTSGSDISEYFRYSLEDHDYNITLKYTNGRSMTCSLADLYDKTGYTAEFSHAQKELSTGTQTGYCTVNGVKGSFSFKIVKSDIKSISLYYPDGTPTLSCPDNGVFLNDRAGNKYFSFFIDRSDLRAKVTYTSGKTADLTLGELISATHAQLNFDDQLDEPLKPGTIKLGAEIKGVKTSLTLKIQPADVTGVKATANHSTATVTWDPVPAEGYIVEYYSSNGWETLATITDGTYKKSWSGLVSGQTYYFGVRAFNTVNGKRTYTDRMQAHVTMPSTQPSKVTGLKLAKRGSSSLSLSWNVSDNAGGYIVEQKIAGTWTRIARIDGNKNSKYTVTGLTPATNYSLRVKSFNIYDGKGYYSEYASLSYHTAPEKVTNVTVSSRTVSSVTLKWSKAEGATGYSVEQYVNGKWTKLSDLSGNANVSLKIAKLSAGKKYSFRIRSYYTVSGTTLYGEYAEFSCATPPSAVSGFALSSRTSSSISVKWNKNANADGYVIEKYASGKWTKVKSISGAATVKYTISGLTAITDYKIRIKAYKKDGNTILYSSYKTIAYHTLPANISGVKVSRTASSLTLSWNRISSASGYIVEVNKSGKWTKVKTLTSSNTSYKLTGLSPSTKYSVRIRSYNKINSSTLYGAYKTVGYTTLPAAVSGVSVTARTSSSLTFKWNKASSAGGYIIEQYSGGKWVRIARISGNSNVRINIGKLAPSTKYTFRIKGYKTYSNNTTLYSAYTGFYCYTAPAKVSGFTASRASSSKAHLSWKKNTSADGFIIEQYSAGKWVQIADLVKGTYTACNITKLKAGTTYRFRIKSYSKKSGKILYSDYSTVSVTV